MLTSMCRICSSKPAREEVNGVLLFPNEETEAPERQPHPALHMVPCKMRMCFCPEGRAGVWVTFRSTRQPSRWLIPVCYVKEWMNEWMNKQALCLFKAVFSFLVDSWSSFSPLLQQSVILGLLLGKAPSCALSSRSLLQCVSMGKKWASVSSKLGTEPWPKWKAQRVTPPGRRDKLF